MRSIYLPRDGVQIQQGIETDQAERRAAFEAAVDQLVNRIRTACGSAEESEVGTFEQTVWRLLMVVGLRALEWWLSCCRERPEKRRLLGSDGRVYKYVKEKTYPLRSILGKARLGQGNISVVLCPRRSVNGAHWRRKSDCSPLAD